MELFLRRAGLLIIALFLLISFFGINGFKNKKSEIIKRENKNSENAYEGNWNDVGYFQLTKPDNGSTDFVFSLD